MPIHLIVQYCPHPLPARVAEYDECLRRNLANPHVAAVHNLIEPQTTVPAEFKSHPKYREHALPRWMTYKDAFDYANANLAGEICCLCNLDIFLDPTCSWDETRSIINQGWVLCQSRIEFDPKGAPYKDVLFNQCAFANSQDAWLFVPPLNVNNCEFEIGILGCDNAIAHRLVHSGKQPVNLADRFRIFHYDKARGKNSLNQAEVHISEAPRRPKKNPEREGYYLVPNFDQVRSVDAVFQMMQLSDVQRYQAVCALMSKLITINNP
jgi:hypothetical protein